jgi:hypothetical protein
MDKEKNERRLYAVGGRGGLSKENGSVWCVRVGMRRKYGIRNEVGGTETKVAHERKSTDGRATEDEKKGAEELHADGNVNKRGSKFKRKVTHMDQQHPPARPLLLPFERPSHTGHGPVAQRRRDGAVEPREEGRLEAYELQWGWLVCW